MENEKKTRSVGDLRWQEATVAGFEDMAQAAHATQLDADKWLAEHLAPCQGRFDSGSVAEVW